MTISSRIDESPLSVLLDIRDPFSYLALHPVSALARELGIEINWLPLVSRPLNPPSAPTACDDRGTRHRRHRANAIAREIATYAEAAGLVVREIYRDPDPAAVNLGWLWLREHDPARLERHLGASFRAYWAAELDPSSEDAVAALVDEIGGEGAQFRAWCVGEGPAAAAALAELLRERGLTTVPCYLVEDEVFIGRQHLAMIRWILAGRKGAGPI